MDATSASNKRESVPPDLASHLFDVSTTKEAGVVAGTRTRGERTETGEGLGVVYTPNSRTRSFSFLDGVNSMSIDTACTHVDHIEKRRPGAL